VDDKKDKSIRLACINFNVSTGTRRDFCMRIGQKHALL